jgi:hypothetical protein
MKTICILACAYLSILITYCPTYTCGKDKDTTVCNIMTESSNGIPNFEIKKICDAGNKCDLSFETNKEDTCVAVGGNLYPGERCTSNSQCMSGKCDTCRNTCNGNFANEPCASNDECDVGLYCDLSSKCKPWKEISEECGDGVECASYLVCNNKKCVLPGSLQIGDSASNPFACNTLYIGEVGMKSVCTNGPTRMSEESCPGTCYYKLVLPSQTPTTISEPCKCGMDDSGDSYCPLGIGDYKEKISIVNC